MTDDMPEPAHKDKATAALDEFMATVLRHLRMGHGNPLEELGLVSPRTSCRTGGRISQVQEDRNKGFGAEEATEDQNVIEARNISGAASVELPGQRPVGVVRRRHTATPGPLNGVC